MARPESTAVAGYYPLPEHLIPGIAKLISPYEEKQEITVVDPCAGDGRAVLALARLIAPNAPCELYTCEMEASRFQVLVTECKGKSSWRTEQLALHGDAFHVSYELGYRSGASLLYLNPPYDFDREHGRLEQKFLMRFTGTLMPGGLLLFVVPFYALSASAAYLATHYGNVSCFRFPEPDFGGFKQVVLLARRTDGLVPSRKLQAQIERYAAAPLEIPELGDQHSAHAELLPSGGMSNWTLRELDVEGLRAKSQPWMQSGRNGALQPIRGILPAQARDMMLRQYPVATPPRPAHIAAGIASGIFNGARVTPDNAKAGLPALLVKGVFSQEYRTIQENVNKDGETTSYVQVQQPQLVVTALNLRSHTYHTLKHDTGTDATIENLSIAGLMHHYGQSLMRVMEQQCPITYDPRYDGDAVPLAAVARKPFQAQAHAAKALVRLLGGPGRTLAQRRGKAAFLLGEVGSGKTGVALTVGRTIGARRPLIMCPPHLMTSWQSEIGVVVPGAKVRILNSIGDLEAAAQDTSKGDVITLLSRETAKLTHGWESVGDECPKCGAMTPRVDHAKKRARCTWQPWVVTTSTDRLVMDLARRIARYAPEDDTVTYLLTTRRDRQVLGHYAATGNPPNFAGVSDGYFEHVLELLCQQPLASDDTTLRSAVIWCLLAMGTAERIEQVAVHYLTHAGYYEQEFGRWLLLLLPPGCDAQRTLVAAHRTSGTLYNNPWPELEADIQRVRTGASTKLSAGLSVSWQTGELTVHGYEARSLQTTVNALKSLVRLSSLRYGPECGAVLYHAVPEPRRTALAKHIVQRFPQLFDFLVLDECHEVSNNGDSAQSQAAQRLSTLGLPTIHMTGSIMSGVAESFFAGMMMASPAFRAEFRRGDKQRFIDRYGYRKRLVSEKEMTTAPIEYGANSDRIIRSERIIGNAPGVLPLFLLKHLLPIAVTLQKADLALELPRCIQERCMVEPDARLLKRYKSLQSALIARIRKDQFTAGLAGKLFGQLAELPSYLDRATADTGNTDAGDYEIRYPESVGSELVATQVPFDAAHILPKEQWLIDRVRRELAEGRNVLVFSWHVQLLPRYAKLLSEATGEAVPVLYADKVSTAKRQEWIQKNVIRKKARIMCVNPVAVSTGLNVLTHFCTEVFMENPSVNAILVRQAIGRVDRIGQKQETRILFPVYAGTLQETLHELLLQKVAVSTAADGLDPESALASVGLGESEFLTGMSIGRQLWNMLAQQSPEPRKKQRTTAAQNVQA